MVIILNEKSYEKRYKRVSKSIREHPYGRKVIRILDKITTGSVYLTYMVFLIILLFNRDTRLWKVLFVPAISFVLLSVFRNYNNAPRPYEILDINPIINKKTKGKSFPSRHVFSTFIIAMTLYYVSSLVGIALMTIGVIIAVIRVLGGVHFPRDVIVGALVGILFGIIGWKLGNYLYIRVVNIILLEYGTL